MPLDDATRLRHMLEAAEEAVGFAAGKTRADLEHERMSTLAPTQLIVKGLGQNNVVRTTGW